MRAIQYFRGWFRFKKKGTDEITEDEARDAHTRREAYVAVIWRERSPECVLEIKGDYVGVEFLDEALRSYVSYQFQERKPSHLFLVMAVHRHFDGSTDKVVKGTVFVFRENGTTSVEDHDYSICSVLHSETSVDISTNWEPYPNFGRYESLIRIERGRSDKGSE